MWRQLVSWNNCFNWQADVRQCDIISCSALVLPTRSRDARWQRCRVCDPVSKKNAIFGRWRHPLSITIPSVCLISKRKRAIDDYRHLLQTMSLIIPFILFAVIITIHISCTGSRRRIDRVFAVTLESLPRIGVVELTNAPYPKHVPFACWSALTNIAVTPAGQPAIGY